MPAERIGFYCELPRRTVAKIRRDARRLGKGQWEIVDSAVNERVMVNFKPVRTYEGDLESMVLKRKKGRK